VNRGRRSVIIAQQLFLSAKIFLIHVAQIVGDLLLHREIQHVLFSPAKRVERNAKRQQPLVAGLRVGDRSLGNERPVLQSRQMSDSWLADRSTPRAGNRGSARGSPSGSVACGRPKVRASA